MLKTGIRCVTPAAVTERKASRVNVARRRENNFTRSSFETEFDHEHRITRGKGDRRGEDRVFSGSAEAGHYRRTPGSVAVTDVDHAIRQVLGAAGCLLHGLPGVGEG